MSMTTFTTRLDELLQKRLGSSSTQKQKAEACGLAYEFFRQIMTAVRNPPSDDRIMQISHKLGLVDHETVDLLVLAAKDRAKEPETKMFIQQILSTHGQKSPGASAVAGADHIIPVFASIRAGNGEFGITDGEKDGYITVDSSYEKMKVFAIRVSGDSMMSELFDGEIAIFKPLTPDPIKERNIYAVEVEGWSSWVVKHVRYDPSGMVQLISANSAYPVKEIDPRVNPVILRGKLIESRRIRK